MSQIIAYYRIASYVIASEFPIPGFEPFLCAQAPADAVLTETEDPVPDGIDISSGQIIHRRVEGGWFLHGPEAPRSGLLVSDDYRSLRLVGKASQFLNESDVWYIRVAIECGMILKGYVSLHASAVALDGKAYAFTGPSGMGKSTRASAWCERLGAELISGDRPLIHVKSRTLYGVPWDGKEQCFQNVSCPLGAIFEVRRDRANRIRALSCEQRRKILIRQSFIPMWDNTLAAVQMMNIRELAKDDAVMRLFCGPDGDDAAAVYEKIKENEILEAREDLQAKPGFVLRSDADEHMLVPAGKNAGKTGEAVRLNETAAFIWTKLQLPVSEDDLLESVLDEYEADGEKAAADLEKMLKKFKERDMID